MKGTIATDDAALIQRLRLSPSRNPAGRISGNVQRREFLRTVITGAVGLSMTYVHTGDLLFNDTYPFIDYSTGGWIGGMVPASDPLFEACDATTRVIPGHGAMGAPR